MRLLAGRRRHRDAAARLQAAGPRGRRRRSATSTSAASAWSPRSSAGRAATRRSRSTPRSRPARSRPRAPSRPRPPSWRRGVRAPRRRAARPLLRRLARPRGGDDPRAGARAGSAATPATAATERRTGSSTSARRSTRRAARTRWSTSRCGRRMLRDAAGDDGVGCVLLDVVIGHGSHADPAGELAEPLAALARDRAGDRPRVRHRRRPAGRAPPGGDAARRRRRSSRPPTRPPRGSRRERWPRHEDRDAHLLGQAARRGRARARGLRGARAARARGRADGARAARRGAVPRRRACRCTLVRHVPLDAPFDERIQAMLDDLRRGAAAAARAGGFDVVHAQDCLSANAALALRDDGVIDHVIRTVHHVDDFTSPSLVECQDRSIVEPDHVLCVSQPWVERLARRVRRARRARPQRRRHAPLPARRATRAERARDRRRAGARRPLRGPDRRRDRAAQGLADAARGLRRSCGDARPGARPAAADRRRHRRCSTTATSVERFDARVPRARRRRAHVRVLGALEPPRRSSGCSAPPTRSRSRRSRRASGSPRSRRWPPGCRSSRPTSTSSAASSPTARARCCTPVGDAAALARALARVARDAGAARRGCARGGAARRRARTRWDAAARRARARLRDVPGERALR